MADVKGDLHISNDVIADIVANSVLECYGVVGMSDPTAQTVKLLSQARNRRGVTVKDGENGVTISVYVILEYGINIAVVTKNLRDQISFVLSSYVRVPVEAIEVHVTGIKIRR